MGDSSQGFKVGSILWALLIGGLLIIFVGAVLLPSTKSARIDFDEYRREAEERRALEAAAAAAATMPMTNPSTVPAGDH